VLLQLVDLGLDGLSDRGLRAGAAGLLLLTIGEGLAVDLADRGGGHLSGVHVETSGDGGVDVAEAAEGSLGSDDLGAEPAAVAGHLAELLLKVGAASGGLGGRLRRGGAGGLRARRLGAGAAGFRAGTGGLRASTAAFATGRSAALAAGGSALTGLAALGGGALLALGSLLALHGGDGALGHIVIELGLGLDIVLVREELVRVAQRVLEVEVGRTGFAPLAALLSLA